MSHPDAMVALRHARLRWLGVPLFFMGLVGLVAAIGLVLTTEAPGGGIMLYVATTGLSLAVFGLHNDTALAVARLAQRETLDRALQDELADETERDRKELAKLSPSPRAALVVTLIAPALHVAGIRWLLLHG